MSALRCCSLTSMSLRQSWSRYNALTLRCAAAASHSCLSSPALSLSQPRRSLANREQRSKDKANMKKKQEKQSALKKPSTDAAGNDLPPSVNTVIATLDEKIETSLSKLKRDMSELSITRVSPALFDDVEVDMPDASTVSLQSIATISSQSSQSIAFTLFDSSHVKPIVKALQAIKFPGVGSLNPQSEAVNDTVQVTVNFPKITKDGRDEMRKSLHKKCEDVKSIVRAHRAWAMTALKREALSNDQSNTVKGLLQQQVDRGVDAVGKLERDKDKELLES